MPLNEETKKNARNSFEETLEILDQLQVSPNSEEDENEEALKYVEWIKTKAELRYGSIEKDTGRLIKKETPSFQVIFGGIYWGYLGRNIGDEINKHRPLLVIRSEPKSNLCTVIPLSSKRMNDGLWYHIDLENRDNTAIVEQIQVISKNRLEKPVREKGQIVRVLDGDLIKIIKEVRRYYTSPPQWFEKKYRDELK